MRIACSFLPASGDINNHIVWSQDYLVNGAAGFYEREFRIRLGVIEPNYPPISIWIFVAVRMLHSWIHPSIWFLNIHIPVFPSGVVELLASPLLLPAMMRWPAIIADAGIAVLIYAYIKKLKPQNDLLATFGASAVLANPAFIYNSAIWGQIDALPLLFILAALYNILFTRVSFWSLSLFLVALLIKQTAVIFVPIIMFLLVRLIGLKRLFIYTLVLASGLWISLLPFYYEGNIFMFPLRTYIFDILTAAGMPYLSNHAFNIWGFITGFKMVHAGGLWFGISYATWAYILAGLFYGAVLYIYSQRKASSIHTVDGAALISVGMFMLLPRMHERHLLMALPFVLVGVSMLKQYWLYWTLSAIHMVNLYHDRWYPPLPYVKLVFSDIRVVYVITGCLIIVYMFMIRLYVRAVVIRNDDESQVSGGN